MSIRNRNSIWSDLGPFYTIRIIHFHNLRSWSSPETSMIRSPADPGKGERTEFEIQLCFRFPSLELYFSVWKYLFLTIDGSCKASIVDNFMERSQILLLSDVPSRDRPVNLVTLQIFAINQSTKISHGLLRKQFQGLVCCKYRLYNINFRKTLFIFHCSDTRIYADSKLGVCSMLILFQRYWNIIPSWRKTSTKIYILHVIFARWLIRMIRLPNYFSNLSYEKPDQTEEFTQIYANLDPKKFLNMVAAES